MATNGLKGLEPTWDKDVSLIFWGARTAYKARHCGKTNFLLNYFFNLFKSVLGLQVTQKWMIGSVPSQFIKSILKKIE